MLVQSFSGVCQRRISLNWCIDPELARRVLPDLFRPALFDGKCIVGIDILKLVEMRPLGFPALINVSMQNATPRIAVEWEEGGGTVTGTYVPFRWSATQLNKVLSSARLFPAKFEHAYFQFEETSGQFRVSVIAGKYELHFEASETDNVEVKSILGSFQEVSNFHRDAKISYTPASETGTFDGLYLKTPAWRSMPLNMKSLSFNYVEKLFPGAEFDSALLMRNVKHEWHYIGSMHDLSKQSAKSVTKKPATSSTEKPQSKEKTAAGEEFA